jgi:preprotein translocase subunit YajC
MTKILALLAVLISSTNVLAQEAGEQPNALMQFAPFILIFFIFYFLMIRPQKKRLDEENKLLAALNKGDEIYTKSGILGTITGVTEKVITIEIADGVKMKVLKSQIGGLAKRLFETTPEKK